jgi:hypothetical protein
VREDDEIVADTEGVSLPRSFVNQPLVCLPLLLVAAESTSRRPALPGESASFSVIVVIRHRLNALYQWA